MWQWLIATVLGAVLKALAEMFTVRVQQTTRDEAVARAAVAEAKVARDTQTLKTRKDMADAQTVAPASRTALVERLRREADTASHPATPEP